MKKAINLFDKNQLSDVFMPRLEHYYFYRYLQISPSYQMAYLKRKNPGSRFNQDLPKDFKLVLKIYDVVGNIFEHSFASWWIKSGYKIFKDTNLSRITLCANLKRPKREVLLEITELINKAYLLKTENKNSFISLLPSKIRPSTLDARWMLIREKGDFAYKDMSFKLPAWRFADMALVDSKYREIIHSVQMIRKTQSNAYARKYLTMLVGKQTAQALLLAENAARGSFPSYQDNQSELKFDYYLVGYFYDPLQFHTIGNYASEEEKISAHIWKHETKYNLKRRLSESNEFRSFKKKRKETRDKFKDQLN
jgi:hypothetical protein